MLFSQERAKFTVKQEGQNRKGIGKAGSKTQFNMTTQSAKIVAVRSANEFFKNNLPIVATTFFIEKRNKSKVIK